MTEIRVVDYVIQALYEHGIEDLFTLTGGGAMFLNDAMACHDRMNTVCCHHEQAAAMAAVGYAKYRNHLAGVVVTSGCGATNAMTGLLDAWQDSVPVVFVSGQVKLRETSEGAGIALRQFGVQEADIISLVRPLTKYAAMVKEPSDIAWHLDKAIHLAITGRPGPVWLDIPQDIQGAPVEASRLPRYQPPTESGPALRDDDVTALINAIAAAERPIVIAGNGVRLAGQVSAFRSFIERHHLPVAVSYLGADLLTQDCPLYVGRLGNKGDRAGNFAVQNADLVIALGCRLSVALTGFEYGLFARAAKLIVVDIDAEEHAKKTVQIDRLIHADLRDLLRSMDNTASAARDEWIADCASWKARWPVSTGDEPGPGVNKYRCIREISRQLGDDGVLVSDAGSSYYVASQGFLVRTEGQRYITSGAQADMGFTLPCSIGVAVALRGRDVVGITGDGSLQLNLQELQTLKHHGYPVKLIVWNNNGYLSIRATQRKFFGGRLLGTDASSGVSFPDLEKIAAAYDLPFVRIAQPEELDDGLARALRTPGPVICEVMCPTDQELVPAVTAMKRADGSMVSKPLEDMYPYLDRDEFRANMRIAPLPEDE